jgi:hypothetical protein
MLERSAIQAWCGRNQRLYARYKWITEHGEIGGPSVKPYQPPGLWEETNAGGNRGILDQAIFRTQAISCTGDLSTHSGKGRYHPLPWPSSMPQTAIFVKFDGRKPILRFRHLPFRTMSRCLREQGCWPENVINRCSRKSVRQYILCFSAFLLRNPTERELGMNG